MNKAKAIYLRMMCLDMHGHLCKYKCTCNVWMDTSGEQAFMLVRCVFLEAFTWSLVDHISRVHFEWQKAAANSCWLHTVTFILVVYIGICRMQYVGMYVYMCTVNARKCR